VLNVGRGNIQLGDLASLYMDDGRLNRVFLHDDLDALGGGRLGLVLAPHAEYCVT
jgi:hypothetical protein